MKMKHGIASLAFLAALAAAPPVSSAGAPTPFLDLPAAFTKSVRGCTMDGKIARLFYNIAVNGDDLNTAQNADLTLDPQARLGAHGGDAHIARIKNLTAAIHAAMQEQAGSLLDKTQSEELTGTAFAKALEETAQKITNDTKTNHQIGVTLKLSVPQKTGETCPAAP